MDLLYALNCPESPNNWSIQERLIGFASAAVGESRAEGMKGENTRTRKACCVVVCGSIYYSNRCFENVMLHRWIGIQSSISLQYWIFEEKVHANLAYFLGFSG